MEQKCKSGTTMMKLCFHIKYKERKKERKQELDFFPLLRIQAILENVKEGRKEGGTDGESKQANLPLPFHLGVHLNLAVQAQYPGCVHSQGAYKDCHSKRCSITFRLPRFRFLFAREQNLLINTVYFSQFSEDVGRINTRLVSHS